MRPERQIMVREMKKKMEGSSLFFVTDYQGLDVAQITELRDQLKGNESSYQVFKNRLFKRIAEENGVPKDIEENLKGFSAFAIGGNDVVQVAKVLVDFAKKNKTFAVKAGVFDNRYLSPADVQRIAILPSREVLIAQAVGAIAAPLKGLVFVLHERIRSFVGVLNAIADKKKEQENQ